MSMKRHCDVCDRVMVDADVRRGTGADPAPDGTDVRILSMTQGPYQVEVAVYSGGEGREDSEDFCLSCTQNVVQRAFEREFDRKHESLKVQEVEEAEEIKLEGKEPEDEFEEVEPTSQNSPTPNPAEVAAKFEASQSAAEARRRRVQK